MEPSKEREIIKSYQEGFSSPEVARKFSISSPTVLKTLKKHDIERRSISEAKRQYDLNQDVFESINPESSYWIGFLLADGCISKNKNRSDRISLELKSEDRSHLEKFRKFLETDKPILEKKGSGDNVKNYIHVNSQRITNDLKKIWCCPKKKFNS